MQPTEVTVRQAAELLGLSKSRVEQFIRGGQLTARTLPPTNVKVLARADVLAFKRKKRKPGRPAGTISEKIPDSV